MKRPKGSSKPVEWVQGQVNWFDPNSGEGSICGDDGVLYRIHEFSEIQNKKIRALKEKVRVEFQLARDSVHPIIKAIRQIEANKITTNRQAKLKEPDQENSI